jgi:hypothetical protein
VTSRSGPRHVDVAVLAEAVPVERSAWARSARLPCGPGASLRHCPMPTVAWLLQALRRQHVLRQKARHGTSPYEKAALQVAFEAAASGSRCRSTCTTRRSSPVWPLGVGSARRGSRRPGEWWWVAEQLPLGVEETRRRLVFALVGPPIPLGLALPVGACRDHDRSAQTIAARITPPSAPWKHSTGSPASSTPETPRYPRRLPGIARRRLHRYTATEPPLPFSRTHAVQRELLGWGL